MVDDRDVGHHEPLVRIRVRTVADDQRGGYPAVDLGRVVAEDREVTGLELFECISDRIEVEDRHQLHRTVGRGLDQHEGRQLKPLTRPDDVEQR